MQNGVKGIKIVSTWLVVLVLALYAAAIYLAVGARRETLRTVGWAFVFVGLLVLAVRRIAGSYTVDALAAPAYRDAAHHAWLISSSILGEVGRAIVLYGLVGVLGAVLAGPSRLAVATRRRLAPILNERPDITWGGAAFGFLLIVLWGGTHALRTWWGILLLGGLLALGIVALRRQTLHEFPEPTAEARRRRDAVGRCTSGGRLAAEARQRSGADAGDRSGSTGRAARQRCADRRRVRAREEPRSVMRAVVALVGVIAFLAAGCGSDKSSQSDSATDWANGVCSAVTTYRQSVTDAADSLKSNVSQAGFKDATNEVQKATDTLVDTIKGLGKPETDAGEQAKTTVDTLSGQLQSDLDTVKNAGDQGLVQSLSTVTTALATAQTQITTAFNELKGLDAQGELSDAFKQASSCDSLR